VLSLWKTDRSAGKFTDICAFNPLQVARLKMKTKMKL
jgi:hypothetical protein